MPDHGYELMADGKPVGRGAVELHDCGFVWVWDMPCGGSQAGTADSEAQAWQDMEAAIQDWYGGLQ